MEDLKVIVPKRFKKELSDRFNLKEVEKDTKGGLYFIEHECPLCREFFNCNGCPFRKFENVYEKGCINWIKEIIGVRLYFGIGMGKISWYEDSYKEACRQILTLRKKAKELITWEGGE